MLGPLLQVHPGQSRRYPLLPLGLGDLLVDQGQLYVLLCRQLGDQVEALEDEADFFVPDLCQLVFRVVLNGDPIEEIGAGVRRVQAADDVHQGGLAGARGADDADEFAVIDVQVGFVQGVDPFAAHLIDAGDIFEIDHGLPP